MGLRLYEVLIAITATHVLQVIIQKFSTSSKLSELSFVYITNINGEGNTEPEIIYVIKFLQIRIVLYVADSKR